MTRAEVHALVAVLRRKLPGLAPEGLAEPVATAEAVDVLMALHYSLKKKAPGIEG